MKTLSNEYENEKKNMWTIDSDVRTSEAIDRWIGMNFIYNILSVKQKYFFIKKQNRTQVHSVLLIFMLLLFGPNYDHTKKGIYFLRYLNFLKILSEYQPYFFLKWVENTLKKKIKCINTSIIHYQNLFVYSLF